jgi:hypothetical protein
MATFKCDACQQETEHDATQRHLPFGWGARRIEGKVYSLCEGCNSPAQFDSGISRYLCESFAARGIHLKECEDRWGIVPAAPTKPAPP